jgi:hypothetical protein
MVKERQFWQNYGLMQIQSHTPEPAAAGASAPAPKVAPQLAPNTEPGLAGGALFVSNVDAAAATLASQTPSPLQREAEFGGPTGPEPTRFGDWERKGRCIDF